MNNITKYNDSMRKSMMDKLFFIDKINSDIIIDFGCADGSMIKMMNEIFPEYRYFGYDQNKKMIELAKENNANSNNVEFYSNWNGLIHILDNTKGVKTLVMSSVLHEIENKTEFFDTINLSNFDYLVIRDMHLNYDRTFNCFQTKMIEKLLPIEIKSHYGSKLFEMRYLIQAIFKSYYMHNLQYELKEDYFSFTETYMSELTDKHKLILRYKDLYILPYWRDKILRDFGIDISMLTTHIKLIYKIK